MIKQLNHQNQLNPVKSRPASPYLLMWTLSQMRLICFDTKLGAKYVNGSCQEKHEKVILFKKKKKTAKVTEKPDADREQKINPAMFSSRQMCPSNHFESCVFLHFNNSYTCRQS